MSWSFAIINGKLAEIYFERRSNGEPKFLGHCYVKKEEYRTKEEQRYIEEDTAKTRLSYRKGNYKRIATQNSTNSVSNMIQ